MTDDTLADFLLARYAEDAAVALSASVVTEWNAEIGDHVPIPSEPAIWVAGDGYSSGAVERTNGHPREVGIVVYDEGSPNEAEASHIARHDPARVLADIEAKRRIVGLHYEGVDTDGETRFSTGCVTCVGGIGGGYGEVWPCETLRALALPYADHPDYRPEWRP